MNLQRREEIRKMCDEPVRGGMQGALKIFNLRGAINELFAHIDALEQTAAERVIADGKARAVVVPEITPEDIDVGWNVHVDKNPFLGMADGDNDMDWIVETFAAGARHAEALLASRLRAIPADRVLGEGMVAVDRDVFQLARNTIHAWVPTDSCCCDSTCGLVCVDCTTARLLIDMDSALRANQGGAAT